MADIVIDRQGAYSLFLAQRVVFIDVRTIEFFEESHIAGARFLPVRMIDRLNTSGWNVDCIYIVYGDSLDFAEQVDGAEKLIALGYTARVLQGNIRDWVKADYPVSSVERSAYCCGRGCCY